MNWKAIQKKYPKGWEKLNRDFTIYMEPEFPNHLPPPSSIRDLYDFFDKQKIWGGVTIPWRLNEGRKPTGAFKFEIVHTFTNHPLYHGFAKSRKSAEKALFTKCFEILEGRLK